MKPQLKEIDGRYYQEAEVVMLATKYGKITLYDYDNLKTLSLAQGNHKGTENTIRPQHLYIVSNETIKESDWFIDLKDNTIWQNKAKESMRKSIFPECKKIIATTNEYIGYTDIRVSPVKNFCIYPQPSDSFIKKYIEEYNKDNIITKVLVEYEFNQYKFMATLCTTKEKEYNLKVDSNNIITIKRLESELYTREQVEVFLTQLYSDVTTDSTYNCNYIDIWIDQNLSKNH